jgi:N-acetylneuraminic acid mutarotase
MGASGCDTLIAMEAFAMVGRVTSRSLDLIAHMDFERHAPQMKEITALKASVFLLLFSSCSAVPPRDLPTALLEPSAVVIKGNIYVLGTATSAAFGAASSETGYPVGAAMLEYGSTGTWTAKRSPRQARAAVAALAGRIWIVGGAFTSSEISSLDVYDPETDTWASKRPVPTPRYGHAAAAAGGKLFVLGGSAKRSDGADRGLATVEIYDPATDSWISGPPMPLPIGDAAVAVAKERIYIIGGESNHQPRRTVLILNTGSMTWSIGAPLREARSGLRAAVIDNLIYVTGGQPIDNINTNSCSGVVDRYDPDTNSWSEAGSLVLKRRNHASVALGRHLLVIAGDSPDGSTAKVEAIQPPSLLPGAAIWPPSEIRSQPWRAQGSPVDTLFPKAAGLCAAAFRNTPAAAGTPAALPARSLLFLERGQEKGNWRRPVATFRPFEAEFAGEVSGVGCVSERFERFGTYTGNIPGYRIRWDVRLLAWPDGRLLAWTSLLGPEPPHTVVRPLRERNEAVASSTAPAEDLRKWLSSGLSIPGAEFTHPDANVLAFSPGGKILAAGARSGSILLWDTGARRRIRSMVFDPDIVRMAFSPDGKLLAAAARNTESGDILKIWQVANGNQVRSIAGKWFSGVGISPDSHTVAIAAREMLALWDAESGKELRTWNGRAEQILSLAFLPDSKVFASGGSDGKVRLWEAASGKETGILSGPSAEVTSIAFSRDGKILAAGSAAGIICLWETGKLQEINRLFQTNGVGELAFLPTGDLLSLDRDIVRSWDVAGHAIRVSYEGQAFAVSEDGKTLATVQDGGIRVHTLP